MRHILFLPSCLRKRARLIVKFSLYLLVAIAILEVIYFLFVNLFTGRDVNIGLTAGPVYEPFKLIDPEDAETIVISNTQSKSIETIKDCNHYNCFDVYLCNPDDGILKAYLYPVKKYQDSEGVYISGNFTEEFYQLTEAVFDSPYFVNDPNLACIFIPTIDTLKQSNLRLDETSKVFASLSHWNGDGKNHLIFNFLPGSFPDYNRRLDVAIGRAMLTSGGFDSWSFRPQFDVSVPVFSPLSNQYIIRSKEDEDKLVVEQRHWLVMSPQNDLINPIAKKMFSQMDSDISDKVIVLESRCDSLVNFSTWRCNSQRNLKLHYPEVLTQSDFCLIMKTAFLGSPLLSDALMMGCIPVILMDNYVLPFQDKIDWRSISVQISENAMDRVIDILGNISINRILEMREQGLYIWRRYFSSIKSIVSSTLSVINERLFPQSVISRFEWNRPKIASHLKPLSLINPKLSSRPYQGFTAVILTYDRVESLFQVMHRVVQAQSCVKVLVIWNNQEKEPPQPSEWPKISVPLKIIKTKQNKLSNRFYPYKDIETEAILAIDDDIIMLTPDELEFGFQVWREFADRIVGFPSRVHRWNNFTKQYRYESEWTNDISMVLTGAAFYHKYYNYLYTFEMPKKIKEQVDNQMNCEDIAMNFLVSNVTGKAPIKVAPRKKFRCPECVNGGMLSKDVLHHLNARSKCINEFTAIYGRMPCETIEFRADPVLFKDNLPEKLKKFHHIGNL